MQRTSKIFIEQVIELLVAQFGIKSVQSAFAKISSRIDQDISLEKNQKIQKHPPTPLPSMAELLEDIEKKYPEKYTSLTEFQIKLRSREVLPESQDIRQFAQVIGLKEISGKSRKDMINPLLRFLVEIPFDQLKNYISQAKGISEQERQQGFSVLTDKLIGRS